MMNAREASARHSLVGTRIGKFDVISEIGTGGMASVYLARSTGMGGFNRLVAIKVMHPHLSQEDSFVEMFLDEARVAATIQHPNVASILDVGIEDGLIFLVMDYVEGDSFSNVEKMAVNLRRRIPLGITLRVCLDALAGLHCAHELTDHAGRPLRIIHRDVSPQNIVVGVDGVARIVDFGIAKAESRITNTQVGLIKGKLNFMAPEQIRGASLDRRVDVFGMGVTLWEAVTLRRLYAGENEFETARKILSGEYPSLLDYDAKLPPVLDAICHKALHPDPDLRFLSAAEFAECIEQELGNHVAAPREVAGFIAGVASQKLEKERRAVREASQAEDDFVEEDDEPSFISTTMVDMPVRPPPAVEAISGVLPSSAAPRAQAPDEATAKRAPLRAPTMSMPSHRAAPRVGEVGGATRAMRTQPGAPAAGQGEDYDDDGATSPFHAMAIREQARALRAIAPSAPAAEDDDDLDNTAEARTMFQPLQPAPIAAGASEDSARTMPTPRHARPTPVPQSPPAARVTPVPQPPAPQPPERSMAIDLVQRRVPVGESTPRPEPTPAPNDLFGPASGPVATGPQAGAPGAMGSYQGGPGAMVSYQGAPGSMGAPVGGTTPWQPGPLMGMPPAQPPQGPVEPAPAGIPAYVYVLASLALLAVAVGVLLYVLRMRG
jgi:serine/threonine protein kinase